MNEYIITCKCGGVDDKAAAGFSTLFPRAKMPKITRHQNIHKLLKTLPREWQFCMYVSDNLIKNKEKFAYYFLVDTDGSIIKIYNLLTGRRVTV